MSKGMYNDGLEAAAEHLEAVALDFDGIAERLEGQRFDPDEFPNQGAQRKQAAWFKREEAKLLRGQANHVRGMRRQ